MKASKNKYQMNIALSFQSQLCQKLYIHILKQIYEKYKLFAEKKSYSLPAKKKGFVVQKNINIQNQKMMKKEKMIKENRLF